jgi:hypothetical protein
MVMFSGFKKLSHLGGWATAAFGRNAPAKSPEISTDKPLATKYYEFSPGSGDEPGKLRIKCNVFRLVMEDISLMMKNREPRTKVTFPDNAIFRVVGTPVDIKNAVDGGKEIPAKIMTKTDLQVLNTKRAEGCYRMPYALPDTQDGNEPH